jgi:apolipoprotein N-acyltransferase
MLRHPATGLTKKGFYGFSWTMFLFCWIAAFIRGDWQTGLMMLVATIVFNVIFPFLGLLVSVWAFFWNKNYTTRLLQKGYVFDDRAEVIREASLKLGVATTPYSATAPVAA